MARTVHCLVRGVVQGVGFRYYTLDQANARNLTGWVKNRSDGSVEAMIEGADDDVEWMLKWLARGPMSASVRSLDTQERSPQNFKRFEITY